MDCKDQFTPSDELITTIGAPFTARSTIFAVSAPVIVNPDRMVEVDRVAGQETSNSCGSLSGWVQAGRPWLNTPRSVGPMVPTNQRSAAYHNDSKNLGQ